MRPRSYCTYSRSYHSRVCLTLLVPSCRGAWRGEGNRRQPAGDSRLCHAHQRCHRCHRRDEEEGADPSLRHHPHHICESWGKRGWDKERRSEGDGQASSKLLPPTHRPAKLSQPLPSALTPLPPLVRADQPTPA